MSPTAVSGPEAMNRGDVRPAPPGRPRIDFVAARSRFKRATVS